MPLSINVGLSRKASKDYQSTGTSINIIAELDAALLAKPDELQKQIDGLYREAQDAIDRNTVAPEPPPVRDNGRYDRKTYSDRGGNGYGNGSGDRGHSYSNGNRRSNGNGNSNGGGNGRSNSGSSGGGSGGGMTDSQRRGDDRQPASGHQRHLTPRQRGRGVGSPRHHRDGSGRTDPAAGI